MKEAIGRFEFDLAEMCFPSPGLSKGYFKAALLHYIGCSFGKILYFLGYWTKSQQLV